MNKSDKRLAVSNEVRKHILQNVLNEDLKSADAYLRKVLGLKGVN